MLTLLISPNCRRSRRIAAYLDERGIPYRKLSLDTPEGEHLQSRYRFTASPGILVHTTPVNPFDILERGKCRIDETRFQEHILTPLQSGG